MLDPIRRIGVSEEAGAGHEANAEELPAMQQIPRDIGMFELAAT